MVKRSRTKDGRYTKEKHTGSVAHRQQRNRYIRDWHRRQRLETIRIYGGKCSCACGCRVKEPHFLAFDHVHGGGKKHLRSIHNDICGWAKRHGWPKSLRLLCHNCNIGRAHNKGVCPRAQKEKRR